MAAGAPARRSRIEVTAASAGLYRRMLAARIRSDWQYRVSFLTLLFGQALITGLEFVTLVLLLELVPSLGGWTVVEIAFLYGLATTPFGITDLLISPIERVSDHVREGSFDQFLLRPVSPLLQLLAHEFELRRIGKAIPAVGVLIWAVANLDVSWNAGRIAILGSGLLWGAVIYAALWILSGTVSFWAVASREAMNAFTYGGQFANQYPLHIYARWIRLILGWAVPIAYVAYVPAVHLIGGPNPLGLPGWLVHTTGPVAILTLAVALFIWRLGIRHYQSTGS